MGLLVSMFVDGSEVDFDRMLSLNLIKKSGNGYTLTDYGKSFLPY